MFTNETIIFKKVITTLPIRDHKNKVLYERTFSVTTTKEKNGYAVFISVENSNYGLDDKCKLKKWFFGDCFTNQCDSIEYAIKLAQEEMIKLAETGTIALDF